MTEPLLCWCCAIWGLTSPAVVADKRLCARCLNSPEPCKPRHIDDALALAGTPEPPQPVTLFDPS